MTISPFKLSALEIAKKCKETPSFIDEMMHFYIDRNRTLQPLLNSHISWDEKLIAQQVDQIKSSDYKQKPLAFVPIVVKDNICTKEFATTCASRMLKNYHPPYDATVVELLKKAGAIIFGKANLDEFAMGSSNETSAFGTVKNPWNLEKVPGGSSGGSAVAVAGDLAPLSVGSDTGGSIRQPASFCGIFGIKPSYTTVSRYGLVAYASSLDQIGPFARSTKDLAATLDVLVCHDERDSSSKIHPQKNKTFLAGLTSKDLKGKTIGIVQEFSGGGLNKEVSSCFEEALTQLKALGVQVKSISLPTIKYAISTYYIIASAEASANLARFDGVRYGHRAQKNSTKSDANSNSLADMYRKSRTEGFGDEVKRRIFLGTYVLSAGYRDAYYEKAARLRQMIRDDFSKAFSQVDLLISPTCPTTAFKIGEKISDPLEMYLNDIYTIAVNLAGLPALSMPIGYDAQGLPIGAQLIGPMFAEAHLLDVAHVYEKETTWLNQRQPQFL